MNFFPVKHPLANCFLMLISFEDPSFFLYKFSSGFAAKSVVSRGSKLSIVTLRIVSIFVLYQFFS